MLLLGARPGRQRERTRQVFAAQFIGLNLALALGGFVAGLTVDLSTPAGARPIFCIAAAAELVSAHRRGAGRPRRSGHPRRRRADDGRGPDPALLDAAAAAAGPAARRVITLLLTLACYAQYDSGLPAYALGNLHVRPSTLGIGVALNAIVVSALTVPVVALTRRTAPTTLLAWCGGLWIGCWLIFALPLLRRVGHRRPAPVLLGYVSISFGESMLAPVLNPFAATLAPDGALGRTLGAVTGATTLATRSGRGCPVCCSRCGCRPASSRCSWLCCVGAIALAVTLGRLVPRPGATESGAPARAGRQ